MNNFGTTTKGEAALYTLAAGRYTASVTNFGATLVSFTVENDRKKKTDIVLGYDDAAGYEKGGDSFGATVGRCANRTSGASFELNGNTYHLTANENGNNLHSGPDVYAKRFFATDGISRDGKSVTFVLETPDGDQGFPGAFRLSVNYHLSEDGSLAIDYRAESDQDTICNPTNHAYFNLNGQGNGDILDHVLWLAADSMTPTDSHAIPTGDRRAVAGTPFDFTSPREIGDGIDDVVDEQIRFGGGYDHNFCLDTAFGNFKKAAEVWSPHNGVTMEVFTDMPGLQFYTGNFIQIQKGKGGMEYGPRSGFALESQYYPDGINKPTFTKQILRAGTEFESTTVYKLRIDPAHIRR